MFYTDDFEKLLDNFKTKPETTLISIIISDKWESKKGFLKAQLGKGFHLIFTKSMFEKVREVSTVRTYFSIFMSGYGIPIYEDDEMAEKIIVEAYFRKNPYPVWNKDDKGYFSDCES
jgi:hypothetical protein